MKRRAYRGHRPLHDRHFILHILCETKGGAIINDIVFILKGLTDTLITPGFFETNLGGAIIDFFELLLTWTWGLGAKGLLLYSHDRPDMLYPSRRCIIWFRTVPDLSAATQFFSRPPSGVHREKGQQSSEPRLS